MTREEIKQETTLLKDNILSIMKKMIEQKTGKFGDNLPAYDISFEAAYNLLLKPDYNLVISGEVNRGKSTFINAIIGRDILPTYDKETTSQVFKIVNSKEESFFIVFDNGDTQTITKEELKQFGSQIAVNNNGSTDLGDKRIAYIQVNTPIEFLPEGVTIVDTPGIGSTYKQHSEITKGFMQYADSIIYLCSAKKPLEMTDISFIKDNVLSLHHVPSIMFVMSKVDEADSEDALKEQIKRSETLIKENFDDNILINKTIFPVSSILLIKSSIATNDWKQLYYDNSFFGKIKEEIQLSIIRTRGLEWSINGFNECVRYYNKVSNSLSQHIDLFDKTVNAQQSTFKSVEANRAKFMSDMGPLKSKKILDEIANLLNAIKPHMRKECSLNGNIYQNYIDKIKSELRPDMSQEDINEYANQLQENVISDITDKWNELCKVANDQVSNLLQEYSNECSRYADESYTISNTNIDLKIDISPSNREYIQGIRSQYLNAMFICNAATLLGSLVFGPVGPVIWVIANIGPILYGAIFGRKEAKEKAFIKVQKDIEEYLRKIIHGAENQLFEVSVFDGKYQSTVDAFVKSMYQFSESMIKETYKKCEEELIENEKKVKEIISGIDPSQKTILVNLLTIWKELGKNLQSNSDTLNKLNQIMFA